MRLTSPSILLRFEGGAVLALSLVAYALRGGDWLLFVVLLFAPDVGMAGYARDTRLGAATYNLFHTYAVAAALALVGLLAPTEIALTLSLIWFAHIAMDRLLGFGLKYPTAFRDTHLGRV